MRYALTSYENDTWFGAQWHTRKNGQLNFDIAKDYWNNGQGKPTVNYEGQYDHLWTMEFGSIIAGARWMNPHSGMALLLLWKTRVSSGMRAWSFLQPIRWDICASSSTQ